MRRLKSVKPKGFSEQSNETERETENSDYQVTLWRKSVQELRQNWRQGSQEGAEMTILRAGIFFRQTGEAEFIVDGSCWEELIIIGHVIGDIDLRQFHAGDFVLMHFTDEAKPWQRVAPFNTLTYETHREVDSVKLTTIEQEIARLESLECTHNGWYLALQSGLVAQRLELIRSGQHTDVHDRPLAGRFVSFSGKEFVRNDNQSVIVATGGLASSRPT